MHRIKHPNGGYSLIELAILCLVLVIVCIFVFVNRTLFFGAPAPTQNEEEFAVALVRLGIQSYAVESRSTGRVPEYPIRLDNADSGVEASETTPLFTEVVPEGLRSGWRKVGANEYVYGDVVEDQEGNTYHYDPLSGAFTRGRSRESEPVYST